VWADTSGGHPIFDTPLRLSELVATLALAQDNAFGQPLESQLRSCLLATSICAAARFDEQLRETVYWVALLRYVGCTGHAHEVATVFGDEIAIIHGAYFFRCPPVPRLKPDLTLSSRSPSCLLTPRREYLH